jgi:hypothetical protein
VAYSDGGTPFKPGDDVLYVADSGRNRVASFTLQAQSAQLAATIGELGSGADRFAGPMAIAVGRSQGASSREVYVADAHTRPPRAPRATWARRSSGSARSRRTPTWVTALSTDQWGNLYASAPQQGVVRKFAPNLTAVAELRNDVSRPAQLPRAVRDRARPPRRHHHARGQPSGLSVDQWSSTTACGSGASASTSRSSPMVGTTLPAARFTLTDQAR